MTALEYIQSKGLEYRIQSGQAILKTCPFCGDQKSHFYMDQDEGAFYCHKCQERGNLVTLQKHYGDYQEQRRMSNPSFRPRGAVRQAFEDKDARLVVPEEKKALEAHQRLLTDPDALTYITTARGVSIETV